MLIDDLKVTIATLQSIDLSTLPDEQISLTHLGVKTIDELCIHKGNL